MADTWQVERIVRNAPVYVADTKKESQDAAHE